MGSNDKVKRSHGQGQQSGDCSGEGHIKGLNGNGKNGKLFKN